MAKVCKHTLHVTFGVSPDSCATTQAKNSKRLIRRLLASAGLDQLTLLLLCADVARVRLEDPFVYKAPRTGGTNLAPCRTIYWRGCLQIQITIEIRRQSGQ